MKKLTGILMMILLISFVPRTVLSAPLNGNTLNQISGVAFHFTQPDVLAFQKMKSMGLGIARTDLQWQSVERSRGIYNFATFDALTDAMTSAGIRPMYILDYSNPIYEPAITSGKLVKTTINPPPIHTHSVAAYSNFAAAAAARYKGRNIIWEIWNEPNIQEFWQTGPNADQYADMAISSCWAIRNADPDATIVGPALAGTSTDFLRKVFARGLLDCLDGVSVHPYRASHGAIPETVQAEYDALKALIAEYTSPTRLKQIALVNSEWGVSTALVIGAGPDQQADYAVRQKLIDMSNGLGASIWYDWKNDGINPLAVQENFGLLDAQGYEKLSFTALSNLNKQLNGMFFIGKLATSSAKDYAFLFGNAQGAQYLVSWTSGAAHSLKLMPQLIMQTVPSNLTQLGVNMQNQLLGLNTSLTLMLSSTPVVTQFQIKSSY